MFSAGMEGEQQEESPGLPTTLEIKGRFERDTDISPRASSARTHSTCVSAVFKHRRDKDRRRAGRRKQLRLGETDSHGQRASGARLLP